jgi:hypothetical protein
MLLDEYLIVSPHAADLNQAIFQKSQATAHGASVEEYSRAGIAAVTKLFTVIITVGILIVPVFILLWIPLTRAGITTVVLISVLTFSSLMSLFTKAEVREVLVGTAA